MLDSVDIYPTFGTRRSIYLVSGRVELSYHFVGGIL
jgi:hypothetical protein